MKILRVASDLYPEVMGGLSLHVHELSRMQSERGHDVTVVTSDHGQHSLPTRETRDGYRIIRHREIISPLDNSINPGILKSIHKEEYDIIHAHSHLFFSTNLVSFVSPVVDAPLLITNHGLMSQTAPVWLQKLFLPLIALPTLQLGDRILCYTETDKKRLINRGVDTKISVVQNGIDCEKFVPKSSIKEKQQILFVGRIKPGKGAEQVIKAFAQIQDNFDNLELVIVGEGPLREELEAKSNSLSTKNNVEFRSSVPNDEMPTLYNQSSVTVLPSESEGMPRTVLESLACGTPVVVSKLPQLEFVESNSGVMVNRRDTEEIANGLYKVLSNDELRKTLGEKGREQVQDRFSWSDTVTKTTAIMEKMVN